MAPVVPLAMHRQRTLEAADVAPLSSLRDSSPLALGPLVPRAVEPQVLESLVLHHYSLLLLHQVSAQQVVAMAVSYQFLNPPHLQAESF